ncbi:hypothetical protein JCM19992_33610 [Thermostilla marina]
MELPLRLLADDERWDCRGCGICCRSVIIKLSDEEYRRIRDQHWEEDPRFRGKKLFVRMSLFPPVYRLAHRSDGFCVFLNDEKRCSIHAKFGAEAKPLLCRMFPYQVVPLERFAYLTVRRNCPSAALQEGPTLAEQESEWRPMVKTDRLRPRPKQVPPLTRHYRVSWRRFLAAAEVLEELTCDRRFPIVRRLAAGLTFCRSLDGCRLATLSNAEYAELLRLLRDASHEEAADFFRERKPPGWATRLIFRRVLADYLRLHPRYVLENSWRGRFRWAKLGIRMALGRGTMHELAPDFPAADWKHLESPLGTLSADVLRPLDDYFESLAKTKRFAVAGRKGWALTERYRAVAVSFAAAMWFLRLTAFERPVATDDVVQAVITIERGEGHAPLGSATYRKRLRAVEYRNELGRLIAWYAR